MGLGDFLTIEKKLGDKIILKGVVATQFYVPVSSQRISIDIDMICLASHEEVHQVINEIENDLSGACDYFKFRLYEPKNPKLGLDALETYFQTVPSICNELELFATKGKQEVKIEFIFSRDEHVINKIKQPELFALETERESNVLGFENLFADKLTTLGPNTIGISDERSDVTLLRRANDFQSLYLRSSVNRDKAEWAKVGYQLDLLIDYIFDNDIKILRFRQIDNLIEKLKFEHVQGPERGRLIREVRAILEMKYGKVAGLSADLFRKRIDRIIWELVTLVGFETIYKILSKTVDESEI